MTRVRVKEEQQEFTGASKGGKEQKYNRGHGKTSGHESVMGAWLQLLLDYMMYSCA